MDHRLADRLCRRLVMGALFLLASVCDLGAQSTGDSSRAPGAPTSPVSVGSTSLTDSTLERALAAGREFRSREAYLDEGTKRFACEVSGFWSFDGISKEVRFFTDIDIVAAAAAAANGEMRTFGVAEARRLPLTGMLLANVRMTARGMFPTKRLEEQYAPKGVHLVLQLGDSLIQPLRKEAAAASSQGDATSLMLFNWYSVGNTSLLTATPLGYRSAHFEQEFAYAVSPASLPESLKAFLIKTDGDRKEVTCKIDGLGRR